MGAEKPIIAFIFLINLVVYRHVTVVRSVGNKIDNKVDNWLKLIDN